MKQLQFISHFNGRYGYLDGIRLALEGGCRWVQLRMKDASAEEILACAKQAAPLCRSYDAVFLLDDHVELVERCGADGVHLGKHDLPVDEARAILGPERIIGGTANTLEDVLRLHRQGADYIGCGPFRFTTTKKQLSPVLGLEGYRSIVSGMREHGVDIPIVGIGGITPEDIDALMETGLDGIALSGTILGAEDPVAQTELIIKKLNKF
ncbi:MAG: thiamine phosphate synthase [Candidatus Cryptobacteroides sp.]|nr:thiamine phosphate synthase [Rikenellaceae bacterium]MDY5746660.1 thiamine phosphate synthase [Candidatus Cryptobacteroides sp.]